MEKCANDSSVITWDFNGVIRSVTCSQLRRYMYKNKVNKFYYMLNYLLRFKRVFLIALSFIIHFFYTVLHYKIFVRALNIATKFGLVLLLSI